MNGWTLRTVLLVESGASVFAAVMAQRLIAWQNSSLQDMAASPDATLVVLRLLMQWGIASGCCVGLAIAAMLCAVQRWREIATSSLVERLQWGCVAVPVVVVVWSSRGF